MLSLSREGTPEDVESTVKRILATNAPFRTPLSDADLDIMVPCMKVTLANGTSVCHCECKEIDTHTRFQDPRIFYDGRNTGELSAAKKKADV